MKIFTIGFAGACALATSLPIAVSAQEAAGDAASAPTDALEEVVVTAEKRTSSAQKTAIAIDVLDREKLANAGVNDISALQTSDAGVQYGAASTASFVTIRGVSGRDSTEIGDPAVAINVDGIFLQRPSGMNAAFFDLERIEVLRGPQGTLYGRNATGGVINIISKRPSFEYGGYAALTLGNYHTLNGEAAINLPVSDTLAIRASVISREHEGYRDNALPDTGNGQVDVPGVGGPGTRADYHGDDEDTKGARLQMLYKPTDKLDILLSGMYILQGGHGPVMAGYPTTTPEAPDDSDDVSGWALNDAGELDIERKNMSAQFQYDFGPMTATYLFGYAGLDVTHLWDNDGTDTRPYMFRRGESSKDISHELRFSSNGEGAFAWQFGAFYYDQDLDVNSLNFVEPSGTPFVLRNFQYNVAVKSQAAFGQVSFSFADAFKISAGLRYSEDEKQRTGGRWAGPGLTVIPTSQPVLTWIPETDASQSKDDDVSYHVGFDYTLNETSMLYAKVDKGYKSGGFTAINAYGPETVRSYEIGAKNRFLDNSLQVNLSAFRYDYEDQQVSQVTPNGVQVLNAGSSRVNGVEAQVEWKASANDALDASINWLDAKYEDFAVNVAGVNVNQAGNRLIQAPEWAISAGYEHSFVVGGGTITPRVSGLYRSESYFTFFNNLNDRQKAYATVDASVMYAADEKPWTLQAYVRNLTDEVVLTSASIGSFSGTNIYQYAAPRTYGVRVQISF